MNREVRRAIVGPERVEEVAAMLHKQDVQSEGLAYAPGLWVLIGARAQAEYRADAREVLGLVSRAVREALHR